MASSVSGNNQGNTPIPDEMKITVDAKGKTQLPSDRLQAHMDADLPADAAKKQQTARRPSDGVQAKSTGGAARAIRSPAPKTAVGSSGTQMLARREPQPPLARRQSLGSEFTEPVDLTIGKAQPKKPLPPEPQDDSEKHSPTISRRLSGSAEVGASRADKAASPVVHRAATPETSTEESPRSANKADRLLGRTSTDSPPAARAESPKAPRKLRLFSSRSTDGASAAESKTPAKASSLFGKIKAKLAEPQAKRAAEQQVKQGINSYLETLPRVSDGNKIGCIIDGKGETIYFVAQEVNDGGRNGWTDKNNTRSFFRHEEVKLFDPRETERLIAPGETGIGRIIQFSNTVKSSFNQACGANKPTFVLHTDQAVTTSPDVQATFLSNKDERYSQHSEANGLEANVTLQAKGYLHAEEQCADWATLDHIGNLTLAVVADAAGNKTESHQGAVEDTNRFKKELMSQISTLQKSGTLTMDNLATALSSAILQTEVARECPKSTSMACTLILETAQGEKYAVGVCIGDARVMVKKSDGSAKDLTPTESKRNYDHAGTAFGLVATGKEMDPPAIIFQKLEAGDTLLMGSDCFGDNMEAKSNGLSPLDTLYTLVQAGKLKDHPNLRGLLEEPWIQEATSTKYWSLPSQGSSRDEAAAWLDKRTPEQLQLLQELHTIYSEHLLSQMDSSNLTDDVYRQCMTSPNVKGGILRQAIYDELEKAQNEAVRSFLDQAKTEDRKVTRVDVERVKEEAGKLIYERSLPDIKEIANALIKDEANKTNLFAAWDKNPSEALAWLREAVAKPDDYSLISLKVK